MGTDLPRGGRNPEATGFVLSGTFVLLASLRDVYLGGLLQRVHPLVVALTAFGLCTLGFLAVAFVRDRAGLRTLRRHRGRLAWVNVTTALAWLSFFFALRTAEPALVQILFFGVGPLSVAWLDARLAGAAPLPRPPLERGLHAGLAGALLLAAAVVLDGRSGLGPQPLGHAVLAVGLSLGGGTAIAISALLCRTLNDAGVRPATLIALRFPGAALLAAALLPVAGGDLRAGLTPGVVATVAAASFALVVLPNLVNQLGVALASPATVRAVLALGPVLVFGLQTLEARLSPSPWTLAASVLYAAFAVAAAVARRRAIARTPRLDAVAALAHHPRP
jgi:drug/metabolite transporter (DMT)-like permease